MTQQETQQLLADLRELIADREREGIRGLAERVGPSEWAELIPELDQREIARLLEWLPDSDITELLEELEPGQAAVVLRTPAHERRPTFSKKWRPTTRRMSSASFGR